MSFLTRNKVFYNLGRLNNSRKKKKEKDFIYSYGYKRLPFWPSQHEPEGMELIVCMMRDLVSGITPIIWQYREIIGPALIGRSDGHLKQKNM